MTTREIDERIAAALERFAKRIYGPNMVTIAGMCHAVAAELRAAEPAIVWECPSCDFACAGKIGIFGGHTDCHGKKDHARVGCVIVPKPAPSPSLIERFKAWHMGRHDDCLHCDVSDALEAAQADTRRLALIEAAAAEVVAAQCRNVAVTLDKIDALAATMERKP